MSKQTLIRKIEPNGSIIFPIDAIIKRILYIPRYIYLYNLSTTKQFFGIWDFLIVNINKNQTATTRINF